MDLKKLDELKKQMQHGKDFKKVWEYFLDHFGEDSEFTELGAPQKNKPLEFLITQVAASMFGKKVKLENVLFVHLPEHGFVHGACSIEGKMSNLIYFEDVQVGILCVVYSFRTSETRFARFSAAMMPPGWSPSVN